MPLGSIELHLLLALSLAALGAAAVRLASPLAPGGLERLVVWATFLASVAVLEALALGLVGLGGTPVALGAAALATWVAARVWLPAPRVGFAEELGAWWSGLEPLPRLAAGALAGMTLALVAILLRRPQPGFDGITYHLPEVVGFVQSGHPGEVLHPYYGLPVGNYPLTNEVLLAWVAGLSHSFAPLTLWSPASALLLIAAGWLGLRRLGVAAAVRVLALGALVFGPLLFDALATPGTDLPALAWLVCCAALCLAAPERPILLVPAVLALGLSIGTKTTPAPLAVIVIVAALWRCRRRLRSIGWQLGLGVVAAGVVGGTWYVRNLTEHGSPLWPFVAASWGDPVPPYVQLVSHSMLSRFRVTLLDHLGPYVSGVSGSTVLLAGGVLSALAVRRRPVLAAAATLLALLAWADAPVTGRPDIAVLFPAIATSVRYLLPVFAAGALALAMAATDGPWWARIAALGALAAALVWGFVDDLHQHFGLPFSSWLAGGAALGAVVGLLADGKIVPRARILRWALAPGAVLAAVVLAEASTGFLARHALVGYEWDAPAASFLAGRPGFAAGRAPVATAPVALGLLAGDRMLHPLTVIGERASCTEVRARARAGWVVVRVVEPQPVPGHPGLEYPVEGTAQGCLAREAPLFDDGIYKVYGPA